MAKNKKWIQGAIEREGALREYFGVKEGQNIPEGRLNALIDRLQNKEDKSDKETRLLRQALLAKKLKGFHKD